MIKLFSYICKYFINKPPVVVTPAQNPNKMTEVKKLLSEAIGYIENKIGKAIAFLNMYCAFVIGMENDILKALESPVADFALSAVLPAEVIAQVPNIEAFLTNAINVETKGLNIENAINQASSLEDKLKALIEGVQNAGIKSGIITNICAALLANLNNNTLTAEEYQLYLLAKKLIG